MKYTIPPTPQSWDRSLDDRLGLEALKKGKVAVILLAGGLGSRLGWKGPKGTFPVTPFRERTLFQLFSDKIEAASLCYGKAIPVAVLTSKDNHQETVEAFAGKGFDICQQNELPYLDENEQPLPIFGPDGNGGVFQVFEKQGVLKKWQDSGVELVTTVLVENALADPVDGRWIDFHLRGRFDLTLKVVERQSPEEKVGLVVMTKEGLRVIEYTEMEEREGFRFANISLLLMTIAFAFAAAENTDRLPFHRQWKKGQNGQWGWKRERYIFDLFPLAKKIGALLYEREKTFVPLKEIDDLDKVKRALTKRERDILHDVTGEKVDDRVLEIDPRFYYPTPSLLDKWRGKQIPPSPYIDGDKK